MIVMQWWLYFIAQDSVTALVALVEYAKLDTNRALYNIELALDVTSMGNSSFKVKLSKENWPDLQKVEVGFQLKR